MRPPGPLLASGRDSDIFEYGTGLVLRRSRQGRSMVYEAKIMEYARSYGYPVPAVDDISEDGTELVMQRIDGPNMVDALSRQPWKLRRHGRMLGELHHRLHEIPAPDWLHDAPAGTGDRLLHLDLHPLNVILGAAGPVVIDWTGASRGDGAVDVALTWVLMAAGQLPGNGLWLAIVGRGRQILLNSFLRGFDLPAIEQHLRAVVEWKVQDPHMSAVEQRGMWRVVEQAERRR